MDGERVPTAKHAHLHRPLTMVTGMEIGFLQGRIRVFLKGVGDAPLSKSLGTSFTIEKR